MDAAKENKKTSRFFKYEFITQIKMRIKLGLIYLSV
jgi:hypothetical protein